MTARSWLLRHARPVGMVRSSVTMRGGGGRVALSEEPCQTYHHDFQFHSHYDWSTVFCNRVPRRSLTTTTTTTTTQPLVESSALSTKDHADSHPAFAASTLETERDGPSTTGTDAHAVVREEPYSRDDVDSQTHHHNHHHDTNASPESATNTVDTTLDRDATTTTTPTTPTTLKGSAPSPKPDNSTTTITTSTRVVFPSTEEEAKEEEEDGVAVGVPRRQPRAAGSRSHRVNFFARGKRRRRRRRSPPTPNQHDDDDDDQQPQPPPPNLPPAITLGDHLERMMVLSPSSPPTPSPFSNQRPPRQQQQQQQQQPSSSSSRTRMTGMRTIPTSRWVEMMGISPAICSLDSMLQAVNEALDVEEAKGILDLEAPWSKGQPIPCLEVLSCDDVKDVVTADDTNENNDNGTTADKDAEDAASTTVPSPQTVVLQHGLFKWVRKAKLILSPYGRPKGWYLQFDNASIVHAFLSHSRDTQIRVGWKPVTCTEYTHAPEPIDNNAKNILLNNDVSDHTLRIENCPDALRVPTVLNLFSRYDLRPDNPVQKWDGITSDGKASPSTYLVHFDSAEWARAALRERQSSYVRQYGSIMVNHKQDPKPLILVQYPRQLL